MSPPWGSLPTGLQVSVPFISPEGCTMSNRRQRLRTMLTPAPICLEGNTSPCIKYSLSGYDWIGCHMTTGDARGYSRYSPTGCYGPVSSPPCHFRTPSCVPTGRKRARDEVRAHVIIDVGTYLGLSESPNGATEYSTGCEPCETERYTIPSSPVGTT